MMKSLTRNVAMWIVIAAVSWVGSPLRAATATFTGASTVGGGADFNRTKWTDTANWLSVSVPDPGDAIVFSTDTNGWSGVTIYSSTVVDSIDLVFANEFGINASSSSYSMTLNSGNLIKRTNGNQGISTDVILGANGTWTHFGTASYAGAFGINRPVTGNASLTFSSSGAYGSQYPPFSVQNSGSITLGGTTGGQPNGITLTPRIDLRVYASTTVNRIADAMPLSINSAAFTLYGQGGQVSSETVGPTSAAGLTSLVLQQNGATSATLDLASLTRVNQGVAMIRTANTLGSQVMLKVAPAPANPNNMVAPWILRQASATTENNSFDTNFVDYAGATGFFNATYTPRTEADFASAAATEIVSLSKTSTNPSLSADLSIWALKLVGADNSDIEAVGSPTLSIGSGGLICMVGDEDIRPKVNFGATDGVVYVTGPSYMSLSLQGAVSGTGGLTKAGVGNLTLNSSANTFTGPVTVHEGQLSIGGSGSGDGVGLNRSGAVLPLRVSFHGTCSFNGHSQTVAGLDGEGNVRNGSDSTAVILTVDRDSSTTSAFSGVMASGGAAALGVVKKGDGTQIFSGANTYTGLTDVQAGALAYGAAGVLADTAAVKVSGGTLDIGAYNDTVAGVQMTAGSIAGSGGVLTSTSDFDLQSGAVSAILGGAVGLSKTTAGTVTLTGANTYSGNTTVGEGLLVADNTSGSGTGGGAVTVSAGATLGGSGFVAANLALPAVTVNAGGTLAPGASPGMLTVTNDGSGDAVLFEAGSMFEVELDGPVAGSEYDMLAVNGGVSLDGAVLSVLSGYTPAPTDAFFIVQNDGTDPVSGAFAGLPNGAQLLIGGLNAAISYFGDADSGAVTGGNDVVLYMQVIPEPAAFSLLALGALAAARRRVRRA
ncbi:MAG: Extracellular serine protease precursor [Lentisphaerae bacterium ADurb.BinA184]|nr:MAG: Extracellular serine protease precursor [Lentisphaerae bacterium ADurb.BinA184]